MLEDRGALVQLVDAPESFDACTCWINSGVPAIAVRSGIPGDGQRLNLAHELGHLILRPDSGVDHEAFAYRFGAAFLVPKAVALRELGGRRTAFEIPEELHLLKMKYGLSMQAWIRRAFDLGVISPETYVQYMKLFRRRGWHKEEPDSVYPPEKPQMLEQLALRALAEDLVTESRAAELVGHPLRKLQSWRPGA